MSATGLALVLLTAALTMAANLLLRAGHRRGRRVLRRGPGHDGRAALVSLFMEPRFVVGFVLYFLASVVWFRVVATEPLSVAYPLLVSCTFTLVTAGAVLAFSEPMTLRQMVGLAVILARHRAGLGAGRVRRHDPDRRHRLRLLGTEPGPQLRRDAAAPRSPAVADLAPTKLESVQRRFPAVRRTTDFHDLLDDPTIDAIAIATPVSTHFELGMAALKAGKHVLAREADDRDVAAGAQAGRRGRAAPARADGRPHLHLHRRGPQDGRAHHAAASSGRSTTTTRSA